MRLKMLFIVWLMATVFLWVSKPVLAQSCGGSGGCQVTEYQCFDDMGFLTYCYSDPCDGSCDDRSCGPCEYECSTGCCDVDASCQGGEEEGGGQYAYSYCPAGTEPTGWVGYLPGADFSCQTGAGCDQWFPSVRGGGECNETRGNCAVNQLCCGAGQAVECGDVVWANDVLPTDTYYEGYRNCPSGARVFATNRAGEGGDPGVYCRQGCSCVTPCGTRPGTTQSCELQNLGTYTRSSSSCPATCDTWLDSTDDDDQLVSCQETSCWQEWVKSCWDIDEDHSECEWNFVTYCNYQFHPHTTGCRTSLLYFSKLF